MFDIDQSDVEEDEVASDRKVACTALVPLTATTHWAPKVPLINADPSFVAQLLATAEREPQTRRLRRGSLADAQSAYDPHLRERRSVARRTRQII
ncbi:MULTISPECIES: hypothetical protein [unclassified Bradyrhizobium]|uniref:hypothetical protein n=1 Tax=unclassified Bradyrhizobium TaxID=2631580 RepID=UPI002479CEEB|nr:MULTISPECIES: hypothetical protein [unclassified Bradyrhizobium]WGS23743.1 hypothetical protein MTX22_05315 [Bradyrhizobium sp. ISRA463]WGS31483.1 hypothetical protein MTX19_03160 [Bradyrhizobium sp. ISRA464]